MIRTDNNNIGFTIILYYAARVCDLGLYLAVCIVLIYIFRFREINFIPPRDDIHNGGRKKKIPGYRIRKTVCRRATIVLYYIIMLC